MGTVLAGPQCPLCSAEGTPVEKRDGYTLRVCRGVIPLPPHGPVLLSWQWDSEEAYNAWYADPTAYHVEEQASGGQRAFHDTHRRREMWRACEQRLNDLRPYMREFKTISLLDIGAGNGVWVQFLNDATRVEATGIEPNPALCGGYVSPGTWEDAKGQFAVVTAFDVFEHLTRPVYFLRHMQRVISPGGLLVIEMPEWDGPQARRDGVSWKHVRPRQHVCLYSREALVALAEQCGWDLVGCFRPLRGSIGKMTYVLQQKR